jgi:site-specific DNA recombinase
MKTVRCAIYTRKSSDEGLEQGFNSLDAQREACAAYILSQASEGWTPAPGIYDDGGISGGTLERPALQRILDDIASGNIDIIVVYKVDRLTRSLLDFSKLVEAFDKAGVSFVSITQSFNTTTSMGRLTLNMLLSFAQFEREVTAERIRDKIAASKAKGMWMGGTPPLGYRPDGRSLAIVEEHAALIRHIYRRYLELGNVRTVSSELEREGRHTPVRPRTNGSDMGGGVFSRGQLYSILKNPIYVGDIAHKGQIYPGLHKPVINRDLWDRVQTMLADHLVGERRAARIASPGLLAGRVEDEDGAPLVSTHASKGNVRYRYYVSHHLHHGVDQSGSSGMRVPARELETHVAEAVASAFDDPLRLMATAALPISTADMARLFDGAGATAARVRARDLPTVRALVASIIVRSNGIDVQLSSAAVAQALGVAAPVDDVPITIGVAVRLTRTGRAIRLIHSDGTTGLPSHPDPALLKLLVKARAWWEMLARGDVAITQLAKAEGVSPSYMTRVVRLAFLSPALVEAILAGQQGQLIDAKRLTGTDAIPAAWDEQNTLVSKGSDVGLSKAVRHSNFQKRTSPALA